MRLDLPPSVRWIILALLGLAVAVAVGIAASELTSQQIGLSSEPLRAGRELAPKPAAGLQDDRGHGHGDATTSTPPGTASSPTTPPTTTVPTGTTTTDDSSAEGDADDD